ncbi:MAG: hypothetical protein AAGF12_14465 [Myxococcota bacterium]
MPRSLRSLVLLYLLGACGGTETPSSTSAPATGAAPPNGALNAELFSEPQEYRAQPPSAELGHRFFAEWGVGDPYGAGIPYPIYRAWMAEMPEVFGASFGELADRYGFVRDPENPDGLPVGFHLTRDPNTDVDFVMSNCQTCHAGRVRTADGERVIEGLGNRQVRIHAYAYAFAQLAAHERFTYADVASAAAREARRHNLAWPPQFRGALVRGTVDAVRARFEPHEAELARLAEGLPGRVATIEGFSLAMEHAYGAELPLPEVPGWTRIPDIVVARHRETGSFDGVSVGAPAALAVGADLAVGVRPRWFEEHPHIATSMFLYMRTFERELPFPGPINEALASTGYDAFEQRCAGCHGHYARPGESPRVSYRERIVSAEVVGTDRARLDAVTDAFVEASNAVDMTRGLIHTRRTNGWVPRPLIQVWARGHYGHAGQWPDLATIATPPEERPVRFIVAPGAPMNLERVGQAWRPADDTPPGNDEYLYDGARPGHGVQGHAFLSRAPENERRAILEYLKTL